MYRFLLLATALALPALHGAAAQDEPRSDLRSRLRQRVENLPGIRGRIVPGAPEEARPLPVLIDDTEASGLKPVPVTPGAPQMAGVEPIGRQCLVQLAVGATTGQERQTSDTYTGVLAAMGPQWVVLVQGEGQIWFSTRYVAFVRLLPDEASPPGEKTVPGAAGSPSNPPEQAAPAQPNP